VVGGQRGEGYYDSGRDDIMWRFLAGWFGAMRLDEIDEQQVERYAHAKRSTTVGRGGLGAMSVTRRSARWRPFCATP
jgi:hypothetical protein